MGKRKRQTSPGCIFQRGNKLYCKIRGKQYATGINATKDGWELAYRMKDKLAKELLVSSGSIDAEPQKYTIKEAFQEFIKHKEPLAAARTVYGYRCAFKYIVTEDCNITKSGVDYMVREFLEANNHLSYTTKNILLRAFRVFLNFTHEKLACPKIDVDFGLVKNMRPKDTEPYSKQDVERICEYFRNPPLSSHCKPDLEFALMIEFMFCSGYRRRGTLMLKFSDINLKDRIITTPNKVNITKDDRFPISKRLEEIIVQMNEIAQKRQTQKKREKVFRWSHDSDSRLTRRLNKAARYLGIKIDGQCFHRLRNAFCNELIHSELPFFKVSKIMRHKSVETTKKYYEKLNIGELADDLDKIF